MVEVIGIGLAIAGGEHPSWKSTLGRVLWVGALMVGLLVGPYFAWQSMREQRDAARLDLLAAKDAYLRPLVVDQMKSGFLDFRKRYKINGIAVDCQMGNSERLRVCNDLVLMFKASGFEVTYLASMGTDASIVPIFVEFPVAEDVNGTGRLEFGSTLSRYVRSFFPLIGRKDLTRIHVKIDGVPRFFQDGTITFNEEK